MSGFYVFELPFITFVIDWLFAAMVVVLLLTLAAHLLDEGGSVLFASSMPTVRSTTKAQLAVLLRGARRTEGGRLLADPLRADDERRGFVQGATYAVVNAQLPALMLFVLIALLTAGLFLFDDPHQPVASAARGVGAVAGVAGWVGLIFPALRAVARGATRIRGGQRVHGAAT